MSSPRVIRGRISDASGLDHQRALVAVRMLATLDPPWLEERAVLLARPNGRRGVRSAGAAAGRAERSSSGTERSTVRHRRCGRCPPATSTAPPRSGATSTPTADAVPWWGRS